MTYDPRDDEDDDYLPWDDDSYDYDDYYDSWDDEPEDEGLIDEG